jgi:hypothetical protein
MRERTLQSLWRGLMTCGQNSTAGVRARMPASLWRGRVSVDRMSRVATSTTTLLWLHRKLQRVPGSRRVSHWPAWAAPHWRIISAQRLGHPSSGHTYRKLSRPSSPASPRYEGLYPVSLMLPSSPLSARGCVMKRCWRSWPRMTWKLSPRSLL